MPVPGNVWDFDNPFIFQVRVQTQDIDSYKHVNNSVYVRWLDDCAREHSKAVGVDAEAASDLGYGMAVRESHIQYLVSAYLGDDILVANWLTKNDGRLRATRHFQMVRSSDQVTLLRADLNYVCIDINTGKPSRMPALFKEKYKIVETLP